MSINKILFDKLVDYINGQLDPEETAAMKESIENDPVLRKMTAVIEGMKNDLNQIEWPNLRKSSHDLFDRLLNDIKKQKSRGNEKRGVNIFDSSLLPLPEGVRPAEVDVRRLKFLIGEAQLELSVYPISPKSYELIGQISGPERGRVLSVELISGTSRLVSEANQFNLFRFPRVPSGSYSLNLIDGDDVVGKIDFEL